MSDSGSSWRYFRFRRRRQTSQLDRSTSLLIRLHELDLFELDEQPRAQPSPLMAGIWRSVAMLRTHFDSSRVGSARLVAGHLGGCWGSYALRATAAIAHGQADEDGQKEEEEELEE